MPRDTAVGRKDTRSFSFGIQGYPVGPSRSISGEIALRAAQTLDELWAAEIATVEEVRVGTAVTGHLFRASAGTGRETLAQSLLSVMASNRTAIGFAINREPCAAIAWDSIANHSAYFPAACLLKLGRLLSHRLIDLPLEAAWTQARFAMELLLRSDASEQQQLAQSALLAIQARTVE